MKQGEIVGEFLVPPHPEGISIDGNLDWLKQDTKFNEDTIFQRSAVIHKHILHNYADLGISTIDKFTYKIVRTFALDLGLSHDFDLEMDDYKIIQPVVALLLSRMSDGGMDRDRKSVV